VAGVAAALSVRWLVGYLSRHGLNLFVWYRLILGAIILAYAFLL
jgi:undecaprenyl-diphosphatase